MAVVRRIRLWVVHHPWVYWCVVGLLAVMVASSVRRLTMSVDQRRARWGTTTTVYVAAIDMQPGATIVVAAHDLPAAMVPPSALRQPSPGSVARHFIATGEVVVTSDVSASSGPGALLPANWLAVSVETPNPGLFVPGDPAAVAAFGQLIVTDAVVVAIGENLVVVGVRADVAARVADAAQQRLATVALSANPPEPSPP